MGCADTGVGDSLAMRFAMSFQTCVSNRRLPLAEVLTPGATGVSLKTDVYDGCVRLFCSKAGDMRLRLIRCIELRRADCMS